MLQVRDIYTRVNELMKYATLKSTHLGNLYSLIISEQMKGITRRSGTSKLEFVIVNEGTV